MRQLLFVIVLVLTCAGLLVAQKTGTISETMSVTGSVTQFQAATLAAIKRADGECSGILETAAIRYTWDGTTPSSSVGTPVAVGQFIRIFGIGNATNFRAIRTTGTSGAIFWTCAQ